MQDNTKRKKRERNRNQGLIWCCKL